MVDRTPLSWIYFDVLKWIIVGVGNLVATFLKKWIARPGRKFLNSKTNTPPRIWICHAFSLPEPFPIRIPLGFLVKGMWGNVLNQTKRLVISGLRTAFFKKTFKRKICLEDILRGCIVRNPQSPYVRFLKVHV